MKKFFYVALVAIAAVAFTSCKPGEDKPGGGDDPQAEVTISVQPKSLSMKVEDSELLRTTVSPEGTQLTLRWKSTNEAVATVTSAGRVFAVAEGEAKIIVDAEGVKPDTCEVTVASAQDAFEWVGYTLWSLDKSTRLSKDTFEVKLSNGMTVHCFTVAGEYRLWGTGIAFTGETLAGAGTVAILENVPTWIIIEALDERGPDTYYVATSLEIVPSDQYDPTKAENACTVPAGKLESLDQHILWLNDEEGTEVAGITGATAWYVDFDNKKYFPYDALLGEGLYDGDETEVYYKSDVYWSEDGIYGFVYDEATQDLAEPLRWATFTKKHYEKLPPQTEESAPRMMVPVKHTDDPTFSQMIANKKIDRLYKKH